MTTAASESNDVPAGEPAPTDLEVRPSLPEDDEQRDAFVERCPQGTFFHTAGWGRVVSQALGHRRRDLVACVDGRIVGVLPLMRSPAVLGMIGRPALISMPFGVYGGPCAEQPEVSNALVLAAMRAAETERVGRLELRCIEAPEVPLTPLDLYATFVQELPEDPARALAMMPKKARAEARKARERHGLKLGEGIWYLDDLYRLYHLNKRSLGSPGLPHAMFHHLRKEFGDRVRVHLVQKGSEPLAAVMSFLWRDTVMAYYSGTVPGADRAYSASNFMYMALREWSIEHGFRRFDFGRSRKDAGAFKFKVHQGFEPSALQYRVHLVRDRDLPSFNPSNPRTKVLQDAWSRLPLVLTRRLGRGLSRYLP